MKSFKAQMSSMLPFTLVLVVGFLIVVAFFGVKIKGGLNTFEENTNILEGTQLDESNMFRLIKEYIGLERYDDAKGLAEEFIQRYDESDHFDDVYYLLIYIHYLKFEFPEIYQLLSDYPKKDSLAGLNQVSRPLLFSPIDSRQQVSYRYYRDNIELFHNPNPQTKKNVLISFPNVADDFISDYPMEALYFALYNFFTLMENDLSEDYLWYFEFMRTQYYNNPALFEIRVVNNLPLHVITEDFYNHYQPHVIKQEMQDFHSILRAKKAPFFDKYLFDYTLKYLAEHPLHDINPAKEDLGPIYMHANQQRDIILHVFEVDPIIRAQMVLLFAHYYVAEFFNLDRDQNYKELLDFFEELSQREPYKSLEGLRGHHNYLSYLITFQKESWYPLDANTKIYSIKYDPLLRYAGARIPSEYITKYYLSYYQGFERNGVFERNTVYIHDLYHDRYNNFQDNFLGNNHLTSYKGDLGKATQYSVPYFTTFMGDRDVVTIDDFYEVYSSDSRLSTYSFGEISSSPNTDDVKIILLNMEYIRLLDQLGTSSLRLGEFHQDIHTKLFDEEEKFKLKDVSFHSNAPNLLVLPKHIRDYISLKQPALLSRWDSLNPFHLPTDSHCFFEPEVRGNKSTYTIEQIYRFGCPMPAKTLKEYMALQIVRNTPRVVSANPTLKDEICSQARQMFVNELSQQTREEYLSYERIYIPSEHERPTKKAEDACDLDIDGDGYYEEDFGET